MTRPIILLDCDGPLANFTAAYLATVRRITGKQILPSEIDRWDIHKCDPVRKAAESCCFTSSELRSFVDQYIKRPGWCDEIPTTSAAAENVERLRAIGDVYIVTSPWRSSPTWVHERTRWCKRELGIDADHVIHTEAKHLIYGDIFVDDKPEHVRAWSERWPDGTAILFDMPHNRGADVGRAIHGGFLEVIEAVRRLLASRSMVSSMRGR